jgi:hypothetical protein
MDITICLCIGAVWLAWRIGGKRYHAIALGGALKRTTLGDNTPAEVFESLFRHHEALVNWGCSTNEIHALVIQSFGRSERHHLDYIRRFDNSTGCQPAGSVDAATMSRYIDALRLVKERSYPHLCGRDRRHPGARVISLPRI